MKIIHRSDIQSPLITPAGEVIYELIGMGQEGGGVSSHSIAHIVIPSGKSSNLHYHKKTRESYFILKGVGWLEINQEEFTLTPGQICLIEPGEIHRIFNRGDGDLEFLAICAPAWMADDSFDVD
jgi:mannose-6-phosphate isomerase-like protein (cupin superfamily)